MDGADLWPHVSRTVDLDGPVHYADFGGDGPPLVLVHGLVGAHVNWFAVAPALARRHRVVALDLPGFGRTPLGDRAPTVAAHAALLGRFVAAVVGGPATLVGNSMGGLVATILAADSPHRVRQLVLVNAVYPPARRMRIDPEVTFIFSAYMVPGLAEAALRARVKRMTSEARVREVIRLCFAHPERLDPALVAAHIALEDERRTVPHAPRALLGGARSIIRTALVPRRLRRIADRVEAPTLVVHGTRDRLVPIATAAAAARRHGWDLEVFDDVGHVPQLEAPARFVEVVETWLESRAIEGSSRPT